MRNIILLFFIFTLAESCNSLYVPATPSVPVFEKKQSLKISSSVGVMGWNANADYTPVDRFYFGADYHGREGRGHNSHESLGAHVGYYFNKGYSHTNFQFGYRIGHSYYADQFSGGSGYLRIGDNSYNQIYLQAFQCVRTWKENAWLFGIRFDMYHAHYSYLWPDIYRKDVPIHSAFPMAFICYQYSFEKIRGLESELYLGYQKSTVHQGTYVGYAFYSELIFRLGISYNIQFGKDKTEELKK